jgi:hypothetical protein
MQQQQVRTKESTKPRMRMTAEFCKLKEVFTVEPDSRKMLTVVNKLAMEVSMGDTNSRKKISPQIYQIQGRRFSQIS